MNPGIIKNPHITRKESVQGGSPIITGTRIPVSTIVIWYKQGKDVDEILELYHHLSHAQVHDALSYYFEHQEKMEKEISLLQDEGYWKKKYPSGKGQSGS